MRILDAVRMHLDSMKETVDEIRDIQKSKSLSKGMKLVELNTHIDEVRNLLLGLEDEYNNANTSNEINGAISLNLITSGPQYRYEIDGYAGKLLISKVGVADDKDPEVTKHHFEVILGNNYDLENERYETLELALVNGIASGIKNDLFEIETLKKQFKNCTLVSQAIKLSQTL